MKRTRNQQTPYKTPIVKQLKKAGLAEKVLAQARVVERETKKLKDLAIAMCPPSAPGPMSDGQIYDPIQKRLRPRKPVD